MVSPSGEQLGKVVEFEEGGMQSWLVVESGGKQALVPFTEPLIRIGKPLDIQVTATRGGLDVDVRGSGPLTSAMITTLSRIAEQHRLARLTRHGELVLMRNAPIVAIGGIGPDAAPAVYATGAAAICAISAVNSATDVVAAARAFGLHSQPAAR